MNMSVGALPEHAQLFSILDAPTGPLSTTESAHVVTCIEESGGTDAVMPVMQELRRQAVGVTALAARNGIRILKSRGDEHDLRLSEPLDHWPAAATRPDALLITPSEDGRLEQDLLSRYPSTPAVVVEDYYESSRRSIEIARSMGRQLPTICVIDAEAERLIRRRFPDLDAPVQVTGPPMFDHIAREDLAALRIQSRAEIGVPPDKKFVALLIPRLGKVSLDLAEQTADAFRQMGDEYLFAPRRHPSDPIDLAVYEKIFEDIPTLSALGYPHDMLANATDLIIAHRSCTGLQEAVRQRPSITLTMGLDPGFTFPLVDAGVSAPALPADLPKLIPELLKGTSPRCDALRERMQSLRTDGQAARRVANIVLQAMAQD